MAQKQTLVVAKQDIAVGVANYQSVVGVPGVARVVVFDLPVWRAFPFNGQLVLHYFESVH